jgi:hypothetical protein
LIFGGKTGLLLEQNQFWKYDIKKQRFFLIHDTMLDRYIKDEEGRKTLTYVISENGNDILEYTCDMIFSADRRKTTCFLTKKDLITGEEVELNPNGNVTSYLEACKVHLGYDKNYKSIGYLSEDMRNLVSMGFTERQQLISNWLPNTSEFLQASKIAQKKKNQRNGYLPGPYGYGIFGCCGN